MKKPQPIDLVFLLIAFLLALSVVAVSMLTNPRPAYPHEWYENFCCHEKDCRPISGIKNGIPWSEVEDMGDYYEWRSSTSGKVHIIQKNAQRQKCTAVAGGNYNYDCTPDDVVRPSRDGFFHGCESMPEGPANSSTPYCIYAPLGF